MLSVFAEDYDSYLRRLDLLHVVHRRCLSEGGRILLVFVLSSYEGLGSAPEECNKPRFRVASDWYKENQEFEIFGTRLRDWAE
jgi:hypothetical protein